MKRLISSILLLAMLISLFAGCGGNASAPETTGAPAAQVEADTNLADAVAYVKTIYKEVTDVTAADFERIGVVPMGDNKYEIEWTADVSEDLVKIVKNDNGMVTIDVNEECEEETPYVLTATLTGTDGKKESLSWNHILPKSLGGDMKAIVDMAYALEDGQALDFDATLTGSITTINTAWSDDYQNITVTILVEGCEDKPIMCYRLAGEGAKDLAPGDLITVTGKLKNYKGTIEFDAGCTLDKVQAGAGSVAQGPTDPAEILAAGYGLPEGQALPYSSTLTGKIIRIDTKWSDKYKNITVTMVVEGYENQPVMCYRLKGEGAEDLFVDDVITVNGTLKNYYGTIEFDAGCTLVDVVPGPRIERTFPEQPKDVLQIMQEAYQVTHGHFLPYNVLLTGKVIKVNQPWSDQYGNITVTVVFPGAEEYPLECFRMVGKQYGADKIQVGDTITVHGSVTNYKGKIELAAGCWCYKVVKGEGPATPSDPVEDPTPDSTLTIVEAAALGASKEHNTYTEGKYYVTGVIKNVYNDTYGNMYIQDADGNELCIYGTYSADGSVRYDKMEVKPVAGDTVKIYGIIGQYNDNPQIKNGWIVEHIPAGGSTEPEGTEPPATEPPATEPPATEPPATEPPATEPPATEPELTGLAKDLAEAAKLANGAYLSYETTIEGKVTSFKEPYSSYKNASFYVDVNGTSVYCHRLTDTDVATLAVGDTVRITGKLTAYNKIPQFDKTATITVLAKAEPEGTEPPATEPPVTEPELTGLAKDLAEAAKLANGAYLSYETTIEGKVTEFTEPYSSYKNATFYVDVNGTSVYCFRLTDTDVATLAVGDTVRITGKLTAYYNKPQFDKTATITVLAKAEPEETTPSEPEQPEGPVLAATLSFSNKANRTEQTTSKQVWQQNGIYLVNEKGSSTSNVADYANPARFYASSKLTVTYSGMTKIVFVCNSSSYATALKNSLSGYDVTVSGKNVTVVGLSGSITISKLSAQVRMNSLDVYTG